MDKFMDNYILDEDGKVKVEPDLEKWGKWIEKADRTLLKTTVGEYQISTVFLGIDHRFGGPGAPILWETMIFGPEDSEHADYQRRYTTKATALKGHSETVQMVIDHGMRSKKAQPGWTWKP